MWIDQTNCSLAFLDAAACIKKCEDQLRRTTLELRTELQSALRLAMGFSNIYYEL